MPIIKCPRVSEYTCTARTAEGLCMRDIVVLDGPMAQCSYLHEQNVRRLQLEIVEVRRREGGGQKIDEFGEDSDESNLD